MVRLLRSAILTCLLGLAALLFTSCAALPILAVGDVLNVAETGKTGFDMVTGLNARKGLEQDVSPDAQTEARLRAVLEAQGGLLARAVPVVTQGRAYVVGTYASPRELERARLALRNIKGAQGGTTLCLFPAGSGRGQIVTDGELRDNILRMSGIRTREVRVHVVEGNAVLLGTMRTDAEREQLVESAHYAGASSVQNYVRLSAVN